MLHLIVLDFIGVIPWRISALGLFCTSLLMLTTTFFCYEPPAKLRVFLLRGTELCLKEKKKG